MKITIIIPLILSLWWSEGLFGEDYAIPVRPGDTSNSIVDSYLTGRAAWETVVGYNQLLKPGNLVKVPSHLINLEEKAYISSLYGEVSIRLAGEGGWITAVTGLIIQKGDTLRTELDSGVEITMENGDRAMLRELTLIEFKPGREREKINLLNVLRGKVISIIQQLPNRDIRYRIQTPTAISLVRGTLFRTKVDEGGGTIFEVLEGAVNVQSGEEEVNLDSDFGIKI